MRRYVKLHTVIRTNPKFVGLASDADRLRYIEALLAAQETEPSGEWLGDAYYLSGTGHTPETLETLVSADLLRRTDDGRVVVPQWWYWQARDDRVPASELAVDDIKTLDKRRRADAERKRRQRSRERSRDSHAIEKEGIDSSVTIVTADAAPSDAPGGSDACIRCGVLIGDVELCDFTKTADGLRRQHYSCP